MNTSSRGGQWRITALRRMNHCNKKPFFRKLRQQINPRHSTCHNSSPHKLIFVLVGNTHLPVHSRASLFSLVLNGLLGEGSLYWRASGQSEKNQPSFYAMLLLKEITVWVVEPKSQTQSLSIHRPGIQFNFWIQCLTRHLMLTKFNFWPLASVRPGRNVTLLIVCPHWHKKMKLFFMVNFTFIIIADRHVSTLIV